MRIFIVDNDVILSRVWQRRFSREHEVEVSNSVTDAVDKVVGGYVPDIVLLDLRLNGADASGITVYNKIREMLDVSIPVIMITGLMDTVKLYQEAVSIVERDMQTRLLEKPVDIGVIKTYIVKGF